MADVRGYESVLHSLRDDLNADVAGYSLRDLIWLELQYRLRFASMKSTPQTGCSADQVYCIDERESWYAFPINEVELTDAISEADKLRQVASRRQKYLDERRTQIVDLLLKVRSAVKTFAHIRGVETKAVCRWFQRLDKRPKANASHRHAGQRQSNNLLTMTTPMDRRLKLID